MKKVLCIGSVTTDVIVNPADSVPPAGTLRAVDSVTTHVGGCASNAAIDLAKLGVPVALSCKVGSDSFGEFVRGTAAAAGVDVRGVVSDPGVSTTVSIVCVGSSGSAAFYTAQVRPLLFRRRIFRKRFGRIATLYLLPELCF